MPLKQHRTLKAKAMQGTKLKGTLLNLYTLLREDISAVANGTRSSTIMSYDAADVYESTEYKAVDLGIDAILDETGDFTQDAINAINSIICFDIDPVISALLLDCPYELYWYDKTMGITIEYPSSINTDGETIFIVGNITASFCVSSDYALDGNEYQCDTMFGQSAKNAAANASTIVNKYADASDRDRLTGYANEICSLTSYNFEALGNETHYGNPWQIIWVFDGNSNTNVVCEGYAKAFQYLFNISSFSGNISVITVTGTMSGGTGEGAHMWNVVKLEDGNNYLVDVTNIDEGTIGNPDQLLLTKCNNWDCSSKHDFITNGGEISYTYDENTLRQYSPHELAIIKMGEVIIDSGYCGDAKSWTLDEEGYSVEYSDNACWKFDDQGVLTIYGIGHMRNYVTSDQLPWYPYIESINDVRIGKGITNVGDNAFDGCINLQQFVLPTTVTVLGQQAFKSCHSLTEIVIPSHVERIGLGCFNECINAQTIIVENGVKYIEDFAFYSCWKLKAITIPASVVSIDGTSVFVNCYELTSINVSEGNTSYRSIDGVLFSNDAKSLISCPNGYQGEYTIPDGVEIICDYAFEGTGITKIVFSDTVRSIGKYAFYRCDGLSEVIIGDNVVSIGDSAFYYSYNLKTVYLPASLSVIGNNPFTKCEALSSIIVDEENPHYVSIDSIVYSRDMTSIVLVPPNFLGEFVCPEGVVSIEGALFQECYGLSSVVLPGSVKTIKERAFDSCTNLTSIALSEGLEIIEANAFSSCGIIECVVPDSVKSIGSWAFASDKKLTRITLGRGLTHIGYGAFSRCTCLESILIPKGVVEIGNFAFAACSSLTAIDVQNSNPSYYSIDGVLFRKADSALLVYPSGRVAANYSIPDGTLHIAYGSFDQCHAISSMTIPLSLVDYSFMAFDNYNQPDWPIYYEGDEQQWSEVSINYAGNAIGGYAEMVKPLIVICLGAWGEPEYTWSEDNSTVTATRVRSIDNTISETETVTVSGLLIEALSMNEPIEYYYESNEFENQAFMQQKKVIGIIPVLSEMNVMQLPEGLIEIESNAFSSTDCQVVIIPALCQSVADDAFDECTKLMYIINRSICEITCDDKVIIVSEKRD